MLFCNAKGHYKSYCSERKAWEKSKLNKTSTAAGIKNHLMTKPFNCRVPIFIPWTVLCLQGCVDVGILSTSLCESILGCLGLVTFLFYFHSYYY
jgi:hypothetical protein